MRHTFRSDFSARLYKFWQIALTIRTEASCQETGEQMGQDDFLDEPPHSEHLTEYDRAHFATYLRLLDAEAASSLVSIPKNTPIALSTFTRHISPARTG